MGFFFACKVTKCGAVNVGDKLWLTTIIVIIIIMMTGNARIYATDCLLN